MKIRIILTLAIITVVAIFITGCLNDGSLSTVEYNNSVVETLNATSAVIEDTTTLYDQGVPNIVTEESTIDTADMSASLLSAQAKIAEAEAVLELASKNVEQQEAVTAEFMNYLDLGKSYLTTYETVVEYYSSDNYVENLSLVAEYDETLHTSYNSFIESNNTLVDTLASYID